MEDFEVLPTIGQLYDANPPETGPAGGCSESRWLALHVLAFANPTIVEPAIMASPRAPAEQADSLDTSHVASLPELIKRQITAADINGSIPGATEIRRMVDDFRAEVAGSNRIGTPSLVDRIEAAGIAEGVPVPEERPTPQSSRAETAITTMGSKIVSYSKAATHGLMKWVRHRKERTEFLDPRAAELDHLTKELTRGKRLTRAVAVGLGTAALAMIVANFMHVSKDDTHGYPHIVSEQGVPAFEPGNPQNAATDTANTASTPFLQSAEQIPGWLAGSGVLTGLLFGALIATRDKENYLYSWAQDAALDEIADLRRTGWPFGTEELPPAVD